MNLQQMAKKKKKTRKQQIHKAIKAKLREQQLEANYFQRTKEKVQKSKKDYSRKNNKKPPKEE